MANMNRNEGAFKAFLVLALIGAINWGLIGFFNWNLVDALLGGGAREMTSGASRIIYALVGLSGIAVLFFLPRLKIHRGTLQTVENRPPASRNV